MVDPIAHVTALAGHGDTTGGGSPFALRMPTVPPLSVTATAPAGAAIARRRRIRRSPAYLMAPKSGGRNVTTVAWSCSRVLRDPVISPPPHRARGATVDRRPTREAS